MREDMLESADVARLLGVTPAAVRQMARRGALAPILTTTRGLRIFRRADVDEFLRQRHGLEQLEDSE